MCSPHWYEWLRRTRGEVPRNPGDLPCGGMPGAYEMDAALRRAPVPLPPADLRAMRELHRVLRHVQNIDLPRLRREAQAGNERNADLRLAYLLNQLDQDTWRKKLQQREKRRERAFAVVQVYEMFSAAAIDAFRALVAGNQSPPDCLKELRQLQAFGNSALDNIAKRFNMRVKRLRND